MVIPEMKERVRNLLAFAHLQVPARLGEMSDSFTAGHINAYKSG